MKCANVQKSVPVSSSANFIDDRGLEVDKDGPGNMFTSAWNNSLY